AVIDEAHAAVLLIPLAQRREGAKHRGSTTARFGPFTKRRIHGHRAREFVSSTAFLEPIRASVDEERREVPTARLVDRREERLEHITLRTAHAREHVGRGEIALRTFGREPGARQ